VIDADGNGVDRLRTVAVGRAIEMSSSTCDLRKTMTPRLPLLAAALLVAACDSSTVALEADARPVSPTVDARDSIDATAPIDAAAPIDEIDARPPVEIDASPDAAPIPEQPEVVDVSDQTPGVHLVNGNLVEWPYLGGYGRDWFGELRNDSASRYCVALAFVELYNAAGVRIIQAGSSYAAPQVFADATFPGECIDPGTSGYIFTHSAPNADRGTPVATVKVHYYGFVSPARPDVADPVITTVHEDGRVKGTVRWTYALPRFVVAALAFDDEGKVTAAVVQGHEATPADTTATYNIVGFNPEPSAPPTIRTFIVPDL
jgi:hypothetical protein